MGIKQDGSAAFDDSSHMGLGASAIQDPFEQFRRAKAHSYNNRVSFYKYIYFYLKNIVIDFLYT